MPQVYALSHYHSLLGTVIPLAKLASTRYGPLNTSFMKALETETLIM